jgi:hypothetical protein
LGTLAFGVENPITPYGQGVTSMTRFIAGLAAILPVLVFVGLVRAEDQTVIVPVGDKPCEITAKDMVRLPVQAISGSKVEVVVTGNAKVEGKTTVVRRQGPTNEVGALNEEYQIKPTKAGTAKITVTVKPPNGDAVVTEYDLKIK